jgi:SagB-type dehydrogenase family enzyme
MLRSDRLKVWQEYHTASRFYPDVCNTGGDELAWLLLQRQAREFPACEQIDLAPGRLLPRQVDLGALFAARRSTRTFTGDPVDRRLVDEVAVAGFAATNHRPDGRRSRRSPSAGALFPVELYLAALRIGDLDDGIYHLAAHPRRARPAWERLRPSIEQSRLDRALLGQLPDGAAGAFLLTATISKAAAKYGERGYRFCLLEAGHIAQSLTLVLLACGVASICLGGFADHLLDAELLLDGIDEASLYAIAFGLPAPEAQPGTEVASP